MLTLAIGMLGIAGLQASSLRLSQGAGIRSAVASHLADLADRVRSNPASSTSAYQADAAGPVSARYDEQRRALLNPPVGKDCEAAAAACTPDELAAFQLGQWRQGLNRDLPGGAGFVSGSRDSGYRVTVMWHDRAARGFHAACPPAAAAPASVRCATLEVRP